MRLFGVFFTVFPLLFLSIGAYLARDQQRKLETWVPVPATVLSKRVSSHTSSSSSGGSSTTYEPHVEYEYSVDGRRYTCDRVTVQSLRSSRGWARSVVDRFEIGQRVEAYHDPVDPSEAYLLREALFFPYVFVLFPMIFVCVGVGLLFGSGGRSPTPPTRSRSGGFVLAPVVSMAERVRVRRLLTLLWWGVGIAAYGHFAWVSSGALDTVSLVAAPVYFGIGVIPLVLLWRTMQTAAHLDEGAVTLDRDTYGPGDEVVIEFAQTARRRVAIERLEIALIGESTTRYRSGGRSRTRTETFHEDAVVVAETESVSMLGSVRGEARLRLPEDAAPTTAGNTLPRVRWSIRIRNELVGCARYDAAFPFPVVAASRAREDGGEPMARDRAVALR